MYAEETGQLSQTDIERCKSKKDEYCDNEMTKTTGRC